jgi:hypothetical protein
VSRYSRTMLALIAGLVISLLVAWAAALWSPLDYEARWTTYGAPPPQQPRDLSAELLSGVRVADARALRFEYMRVSAVGLRFEESTVSGYSVPFPSPSSPFQISSDQAATRTLRSWRAGWPVRCFEGTATYTIPGYVEEPGAWVIRIAPRLRPYWRKWWWWYRPQDDYLPFQPMPVGLLVDTIIYAAAALLLARAPISLRTYLRRRRGLCGRCAYDLRSLPHNTPCPECGTPGPARTVTAPSPSPSPPPAPTAPSPAAPHSP